MTTIKMLAVGPCCLVMIAATCSSAQGQSYVEHDVIDSHGTGGLAMKFKVPQGWNIQDSVTWNYQIPVSPMSYSITAVSPTKNTWMSFLSSLSFDYAATGYGTPFGKLPPETPSDFLIQYFQRIHPNTPFKVLDRQDHPVAFPYPPSIPNVATQSFHSVLTAEFDADGITKQQQISMDYYAYRQNMGPKAYQGNWIASDLMVLTAPAGHLQEIQGIGKSVISSERINPDFVKEYQKVSQMVQDRVKKESQERLASDVQDEFHLTSNLHSRVMNPDEFLIHESIKQLRCKVFTRWIGN